MGYTITFTKSQPITIMHGKDGVSGAIPIIGVKKHSDNLYYWTIKIGSAEATWMKDADGNMIPTTGDKGVDGEAGIPGVDGKPGHTPVLSIAKDGDRYYWQVDGKWMEDADGNKVPATGEKGDTGAAGSNGTNGSQGAQGEKGDSFFDSVTPDATKGTVVFKLADGTEITLPMLSTTISFDAYTPLQITATGTETAVTVKLPLTLKKADFAAIKANITNVAGTNSAITRATAEKWTVALTSPTFKADGTLDAQPTVKVTVPATATVDETALLEVTVVDAKGNKSSSTRVLYYSNQVAVTGVTLDNASLTVNVGATGTTTATVAPADASNKKVNWTSSDATIATVADGVVTGVKVGTATITATTEDGSFTATCAVTVENIAVTAITLTDATVSIGGKKTLVPTFTPTDATIKTVTWTSSDAAIATVSATGEVEGKAAGEVTITATSTSNTTVTGTCKVTVTAEKPNYIEVNGIKVAVGNLVADGANSAKIGAATDVGLFFQFGSLIGWSTTDSPTIAVKPATYAGGDSWDSSWKGDPAIENIATGTGDPCKYYLKGTWRLPTTDEYKTLFNNVTTKTWADSGGWSWDDNSESATHTDGLTFPMTGYRGNTNGFLINSFPFGYYWSASPSDDNRGYNLVFTSSIVIPSNPITRTNGYPVRCVQASN